MPKTHKGQSSLEYATLIFCLVLALIAMRAYITRGMQGRLRQAADGLGAQYDPRQTTSDITIRQDSRVVSTTSTSTDPVTNEQITNRTTNVLWDRESRSGWEIVESLPVSNINQGGRSASAGTPGTGTPPGGTTTPPGGTETPPPGTETPPPETDTPPPVEDTGDPETEGEL